MAKKVLIIEDISINLILLTSLLQKTGYEVQGAENMREGVKYAKVMTFDILFCDLRMSANENSKLIKMIKSDERLAHIPIVVLSAMTLEQMRIDRGDITAYIAKPAQPGIIIEKLKNIMPPDHQDEFEKGKEKIESFEKRAEARRANVSVDVVDGYPVKTLALEEINIGQVIGAEVIDKNGLVILPSGTEVSDKVVDKLKTLEINEIKIRM